MPKIYNMSVLVDENLEILMKQYLSTIYCDLECKIENKKVSWFKFGKIIASVDNEYPGRLRLSSTEFYSFMRMFSLPWEKPGDDELAIQLISSFLKFDGGTEAIPVLVKLGIISEINHIALPSNY